ncbi:hypothetical protein FOA52_011859 [Chlamydomonas sp. UWO 241]|nr:hypothetical protein FOA52_011859 [Chlamydomonas sp. UWO 241]
MKRCGGGALLVLALASLASLSSGHVVFVEPEAARHVNAGWQPNGTVSGWAGDAADPEDFSFKQPFDVLAASVVPGSSAALGPTREGAQPAAQTRPGLSMLIMGLLHNASDVEWFLYNKTDASPALLLGYVVVPACTAYLRVFPSLALLGPLTNSATGETAIPAPDAAVAATLPFEVPLGYTCARYGAIVVHHGNMGMTQQRPIYHEQPWTENKYFFPAGLTSECLPTLLDPNTTCDLRNIILREVNAPGAFYWVVFTPSGDDGPPWPRDYALVTGTDDAVIGPADYLRFSGIQPWVRHGRSLHHECREPYTQP